MILSKQRNLRYTHSRKECNNDIGKLIHPSTTALNPYHSLQEAYESDNYGSDQVPRGGPSLYQSLDIVSGVHDLQQQSCDQITFDGSDRERRQHDSNKSSLQNSRDLILPSLDNVQPMSIERQVVDHSIFEASTDSVAIQ